MGNQAAPGQTRTNMYMKFERPVQQAGTIMNGSICLKIGSADEKMLEQFTSGAMFELTLRGDEKIFWANGYSHNPSNPTQKTLT